MSAHLRVLAEVGFLLADHKGTASYYRINDACVECFPTAADIVMGARSPLSRSGLAAKRQEHLVTVDHAAPATPGAVIGRYSGLARAALAGETPVDCDPGAFADGRFGAAAYADDRRMPRKRAARQPRLRQPGRRRRLQPGDTVLDLGSGGGLDVLLSARRVGPSGTAYGLDASTDMLELARANAAQAGSPMLASCTATSRTSPCPAGRSTSSSPTA